jgi:hypothetical protein
MPDGVPLFARGVREGFGAIDALGLKPPANLRAIFSWLPNRITIAYWRRLFGSPRGEAYFAWHARTAWEEGKALAGEVQALVRARHTGVRPTLRRHRRVCGRARVVDASCTRMIVPCPPALRKGKCAVFGAPNPLTCLRRTPGAIVTILTQDSGQCDASLTRARLS